MRTAYSWKELVLKLSFTFSILMLVTYSAFTQKAIFMLRHAEIEIYDDTDRDLSQVGEARAQVLANLLRDAGVTTIYTSRVKRTNQTAKPLATILKIEPIIVSEVAEQYSKKMQSYLAKHSKDDVVVILGHINTFIPLLRAMGYKDEIKMGEYEHDDLFVVFPKEGTAPTVIKLNY